jgi:hypothetical protein
LPEHWFGLEVQIVASRKAGADDAKKQDAKKNRHATAFALPENPPDEAWKAKDRVSNPRGSIKRATR